MNAPHLKIVRTVLTGDVRPTFFVDLITVDVTGVRSWSNLRCFDEVHQARAGARFLATQLGVKVDDTTQLVAA